MRANHVPDFVQRKLDRFAQTVEHLTEQVTKTQEAISGARQRLGGGFERDEEYRDLRATLDKLVADQPILERKLDAARHTLADVKAWLDGLPDDAELVPVASAKPNGYDLVGVQSRIANAEDEIKQLRAVPVPSSDIDERIRKYVAALARPQVSGIATGQQLQVHWPDNVIAVLALLLPDQMTNALLKKIERQAHTPMPLPQRKKRIAELKVQIDTLQRQELALDPNASGLPPEVILGVRVAETKATRAA